jgi:hypothetical protein
MSNARASGRDITRTIGKKSPELQAFWLERIELQALISRNATKRHRVSL